MAGMTITARPPATAPPDTGRGRWRVLAELTADGFGVAGHDEPHGSIAEALAALFDGVALVVAPGDDGAVVARGPMPGGLASAPAGAVSVAREAMASCRVLRDDLADGEITLAAPLYGPSGVIGAVVVTGGATGEPGDVAVLRCFAAHAARALVEGDHRRATGELAGGVAHHLNNLMTVALGNVQLMLRRAGSDAGTRSLAAIERAVLDAADVVRRLAASTGRPLVGTEASLDLNALVDDTLAVSHPLWHDQPHARGIAIDARFERGELPTVVADEADVRELLLNLVLNAVDALAEGGEIVVRTWMDAGRVACAVSDTGGGMTTDVRRRATEPFFTTRGPARHGLGLSLAAAVVERHHGTLAIRSGVGEGTTVTFTLPVGDPSVEVFRDIGEPAVHALRVLVVDDESAVRTTIAELITANGDEAVEAASGEDALKQLDAADGAFDVVLTDLGMPGLTGWDVIERVKTLWPTLPVILVTGWGEHARGGARRRAPDAVLAKPLTERRLREVIAGVVR